MPNRTAFYTRASYGLLIFVLLGYVVKFYPDQLVGFDSSIQTLVRGGLPLLLTTFFAHLTVMGDTLTQVLWVALFSGLFYFWKNWRAEAALVLASGSLAGMLIPLFKLLYGRVRPGLPHLVEAGGYSFPSGHATGALLIFGSLLIVASQRLDKGWQKVLIQTSLIALIILVGLSRIYFGVHYPSDVLAGYALAYGVLNLIYPTYMFFRFKWRFQGLSK